MVHTNSDSAKREILIPKGQKERKSVTFAIRLRKIWYDREKVSNFEIVVAKLKETLRNVKFATQA